MIPYADFLYFGLLLYVVVPTLVLGVWGKAGPRWALAVTIALALIQYWVPIPVFPGSAVRELWILAGYVLYQWALARVALTRRTMPTPAFSALVFSATLPLLVAKWLPAIAPGTEFGFLGISYVTFRALDVLFSIRDNVIKALPASTYVAYLAFIPTISSGPIDRFRRFEKDWKRKRTRSEFLADLNVAVQLLFRGFLYKFILAALIQRHWLGSAVGGITLKHVGLYFYGYAAYLFFDFAGYSAFAIAFSRLLGIATPDNFNLPFIARNIKDFWNRWHISLSTWFRDHVYMRFLLTATKNQWFKNKHVASGAGYFLSFGLMGIWHGTQWNFIAYGLYHAGLLTAYDSFSRWNKTRKLWGDGPVWRTANVLITFHCVALGFLLFSGHLTEQGKTENLRVHAHHKA